MHDIFLSYSREDQKMAMSLSKALEKSGLDLWWDINIPTGRSYDRVIEQALKQASCVIVLWSRHSIKSEWVLSEAAEGKKRNILIPILIEDVEPPLGFSRLHAANFIKWNKTNNDPIFKRLIKDIHLVLNDDDDDIDNKNNSSKPKNLFDQLISFIILLFRKYIKWFIVLMIIIAISIYYYKIKPNDDINSNDQKIAFECPQKLSGIIKENIGEDLEINRNSGVHILLLNEAGTFLDSTTVDDSGYYEFIVECNKNYSLIASKTEYRRINKDIKASKKKVVVNDLDLPKFKCTIEFNNIINFDFDKWSINPESEETLKPLISALTTYPDIQIIIEAHTDFHMGGDNPEDVSEKYRLKFTERQAMSLRDYLIYKGVNEGQILKAIGLGNKYPIISKEEIEQLTSMREIVEARNKNRRAIIKIVGCDD